MKKIAVGGFFHESNSFNPIRCGIQDFVIFRGAEIYENAGAYPLAKGMLDYFAENKDYQIIPLVFARAVPNGLVDKELYFELKADFFARITTVPDLFLLPLHGSMRVQDIGSAETDLLAAIRAKYPNTPIICGLDLHATLTDTMLANSQAMVAFKTAPHIDAWETGVHAAKIAERFLSGQVQPTQAAKRLPILIAGEKSETDSEPMRSLIALLRKIEAKPGVLAASYLLGFPWADHPDNGVNALVVTDNDANLAEEYATLLAKEFLAVKEQFNFSMPAFPPREALLAALGESVKPVFVSDAGDNPTAGSTADNTQIIRLLSRELSKQFRRKKILVAGIYDPEATSWCKKHLNEAISLKTGGNYDTKYSQPAQIKGRAIRYLSGFGAFKAELILFQTADFDLILSSKHIGFTSLDLFKALELDYLEYDVIIVKLGYLTPDFSAIAAKHYLALSYGCTDAVLSRLDYRYQYEML